MKKFIYESGLDAFSYLIVFLLSIVCPTIISWIIDEVPLLLLTMFINSMGLSREYILLIKNKKVGKRYWIERLLGITISVLTMVYSVGALLFLVNDLGTGILQCLNIVFSVLFLCPGVISALEGILYIKKDYDENVVRGIVVAEGTATDI